MKRVVVIGAGFAGVSALKRLTLHKKSLEITVIDKKRTFDFLPALPDVLGGRIDANFLSYPLDMLCRKLGCHYLHDKVMRIDLGNAIIETSTKKLTFDYVIIASGTETSFYGNYQIRSCSFTLDSLQQAASLRQVCDKFNKQVYR